MRPHAERHTNHRKHGALLRGSVLALLAALAGLPAAPAAEAASDPEAVELARGLVERLGGADAWEEARFFRFSFAGFRTHHWDRWDGRHRLEFTDREGHRHLILHNVQSREGKAWKDGEELTGAAAEEALEGAYAAWINDTYWLLAPFKLLDPGVTLTYEGEERLDDALYDKVGLSFDGVGLTPGDRYWMYINRETGLLDRWAYVLESYEEDQPATHWRWLDWDRHGGLLLSSRRKSPDSGRELILGELAVTGAMADAVFTSPTLPASSEGMP